MQIVQTLSAKLETKKGTSMLNRAYIIFSNYVRWDVSWNFFSLNPGTTLSAMQRCGKCERTCGNPVMTFPIKKRTSTALFTNRTGTIYIGETRIRVAINVGEKQVGTCWLEERVNLAQKCYLDIKWCGNKRSSVNLSWNEFGGNLSLKCCESKLSPLFNTFFCLSTCLWLV